MRLDKGQIEVVDDKVAEILWNFFYRMIGSSLKNSHHEWTQEQIQKEIARRVLYGTK